jgi:ATP-dependent protease ClpP protease subunit
MSEKQESKDEKPSSQESIANGEAGKSPVSPKPNPAFRANPNRAIFIQRIIDQQLVDRLLPEIIRLQSQSREPITVYIDSRGGSTASAEILLRLLGASDQDGSKPCRLITVATSIAASAAADILCSGDYACAYRRSVIVHHGTSRLMGDEGLNLQAASSLTQVLRMRNDRFAMTLANQAIGRLVFRYVSLQSGFADFRKEHGKNYSDIHCFIGLTSERLSDEAKNVLSRALARFLRYQTLLERATKRTRRGKKPPARQVDFEALVLKAVIDFERSEHRKDESWTFEGEGLAQVSDDFYLVSEYVSAYETDGFNRLCERWGMYFLTDNDRIEAEKITEEDKRKEFEKSRIQNYLRPLWLFFVALCHALQEGENELSAVDAYWLGLIDEVIGSRKLVSLRMVVEEGPPPETPQT